MRSPLFAISKMLKTADVSPASNRADYPGPGSGFCIGRFRGHALEGFEDAGSVGLEIFLYHVF